MAQELKLHGVYVHHDDKRPSDPEAPPAVLRLSTQGGAMRETYLSEDDLLGLATDCLRILSMVRKVRERLL